jgi:hypothetical protein
VEAVSVLLSKKLVSFAGQTSNGSRGEQKNKERIRMDLHVTEFINKLLFRRAGLKHLELIGNKLARMSNTVNDEIRKRTAGSVAIPVIHNFDRTEKLSICILEEKTPWADQVCERSDTPGMILEEECKYYSYIGQFYSGKGEVVELGPWLGNSTLHILKGLESNPNWANRKLHVYDDFVWRSSWMDKWILNETMLPFKPNNHENFYPLFVHFTTQMRDHILAYKRKIDDYDGNEKISKLEWDKGPIEILYVDCGRTFSVNEAWFNIFSHAFIPGVTLLIMQDWRTHREVPLKWYNQIKQFTDSKGTQLTLIHELGDGGIATFLYRGSGEG